MPTRSKNFSRGRIHHSGEQIILTILQLPIWPTIKKNRYTRDKKLRRISETIYNKKKTIEKSGIGAIRYRFKNNSIHYIQGDTRQV